MRCISPHEKQRIAAYKTLCKNIFTLVLIICHFIFIESVLVHWLHLQPFVMVNVAFDFRNNVVLLVCGE
jgi:hypothetical protein